MAMAGVTEKIRPSIFVMTMVAMIVATVAQIPPSSSGCTSALVSLSPCLAYVTSNGTTSPPSQSCCSALSSVVKTNPMCLCQLLSGNNALGISINQTQALALPQACNVTTPPPSQCKAAGAPAPAPTPSKGGLSNGPSPSPTTVSVPSPAPSTSTSPPSPTAASPPANTQPSGVPPPASLTPTSTPSPTAASPSANTDPSGVTPTSSVGGVSPAGKSNGNPTINTAGGHFIISRIVGLLVGVIVLSVVW